ncbi:hypothetical protein [Staphylococcus gallinarum]|nr:hypothetical protein [Staphylococcus gallinarum]MCD8844001.1 hypothetical protein [Staphylococcus gallinarum]
MSPRFRRDSSPFDQQKMISSVYKKEAIRKDRLILAGGPNYMLSMRVVI